MSGTARPGFTLLETALALMVVGVAGVAVLGALGAELRGAERARAALVGEALAEERFNVLELLSREELVSVPDSLRQGRFEGPFDDFAWTMRADPSPEEPRLFAASVEVRWPEGRYRLEGRLFRSSPGP